MSGGKPQFIPDYVAPNQDPLWPTQAEFDWRSLYFAMGEGDEPRTAQEAAGDALRAILHYLIQDGRLKPGDEFTIGRRTVALAMLACPDVLPSKSVAVVARQMKAPVASLEAHLNQCRRALREALASGEFASHPSV